MVTFIREPLKGNPRNAAEALLPLPASPEPRRFAAETLRPVPRAVASAAEAEAGVSIVLCSISGSISWYMFQYSIL